MTDSEFLMDGVGLCSSPTISYTQEGPVGDSVEMSRRRFLSSRLPTMLSAPTHHLTEVLSQCDPSVLFSVETEYCAQLNQFIFERWSASQDGEERLRSLLVTPSFQEFQPPKGMGHKSLIEKGWEAANMLELMIGDGPNRAQASIGLPNPTSLAAVAGAKTILAVPLFNHFDNTLYGAAIIWLSKDWHELPWLANIVVGCNISI